MADLDTLQLQRFDKGERLAYRDGNIELQGETFPPSGQPNGRAVLIVHEADGIGGNVRRHAHDLAQRGYFVVAADMHGNGRPLEGAEMADAVRRFREQPDLVRRRVTAGYEALRKVSGIGASNTAAIGFCFGGFSVLELARSGAAVAAVASFHGLLTTGCRAEAGKVKAPIAVFTGALDPLVPPQDIMTFQEEMTTAGADWQLNIYGNALHSFTNKDVDGMGDERMAYDPVAHHLSWRAMLDFFDANLAGNR